MTLTRCLLVDVYLFVGKLATKAYDEEWKEDLTPTGVDELEGTLRDPESLASPGCESQGEENQKAPV